MLNDMLMKKVFLCERVFMNDEEAEIGYLRFYLATQGLMADLILLIDGKEEAFAKNLLVTDLYGNVTRLPNRVMMSLFEDKFDSCVRKFFAICSRRVFYYILNFYRPQV